MDAQHMTLQEYQAAVATDINERAALETTLAQLETAMTCMSKSTTRAELDASGAVAAAASEQIDPIALSRMPDLRARLADLTQRMATEIAVAKQRIGNPTPTQEATPAPNDPKVTEDIEAAGATPSNDGIHRAPYTSKIFSLSAGHLVDTIDAARKCIHEAIGLLAIVDHMNPVAIDRDAGIGTRDIVKHMREHLTHALDEAPVSAKRKAAPEDEPGAEVAPAAVTRKSGSPIGSITWEQADQRSRAAFVRIDHGSRRDDPVEILVRETDAAIGTAADLRAARSIPIPTAPFVGLTPAHAIAFCRDYGLRGFDIRDTKIHWPAAGASVYKGRS